MCDMNYLKESEIEFLEENGYLILKNMFTAEEVEKYKTYASNSCSLSDFKGSPPGDAMSLPGMAELLLDKRFTGIAHDILGDEVIYFGDSALHCKPNDRIFHKDSRGYYGDPSTTEYPLYRMGIFFQDHYNHSGGIKFRSGSHKRLLLYPKFLRSLTGAVVKVILGNYKFKSLLNLGKIVNARSRIGDIVIWNLRTDHSGGAVLLKSNPNKAFLPVVDNRIPLSRKLKEHETRMALFCCFGAPSLALEGYIQNKVNNPKYAEHWAACDFNKDEVRILAEKGKIQLDTRGLNLK